MTLPPVLEVEGLLRGAPAGTAVLATPSVRDRVAAATDHPLLVGLAHAPEMRRLVVVGGGTLIDGAKAWRVDQAPDVELVAIPSIWGSGAEASPVAVADRGGKKAIRLDPRLLPDARAIWPDLAESISPARARQACADCWAHALEGFMSPLANGELRTNLGALMAEMEEARPDKDPRWFEWSARACAGLGMAAAGLVHGIAHTLEAPLRDDQPGFGWGHARLCATFLWPVMCFNASASDGWANLAKAHGLDAPGVMAAVGALWDEEAYDRALPVFSQFWRDVLRDPSSRTNAVLVRLGSMEYFTKKVFA